MLIELADGPLVRAHHVHVRRAGRLFREDGVLFFGKGLGVMMMIVWRSFEGDERFVVGVLSFVRNSRRSVDERLWANVAFENAFGPAAFFRCRCRRIVAAGRGTIIFCGRHVIAHRRMMISLVQHQHVRLRERLLAYVAHERTFAGVRSPVTDHVVAFDERFLAKVAFVRLLAGVRPALVRFHAAQQRERHAANVARVRLFAGVRPPVRGQRAQLQERFLADVALEQLLAAVHFLVLLEVARVYERLAARVALERFFPGMGPPVHFELVRIVERPLAYVALQPLPFAAFPFAFISRLIRRRSFRPDRRRRRFGPVHFPDVLQQRCALVERLLALGAFELLRHNDGGDDLWGSGGDDVTPDGGWRHVPRDRRRDVHGDKQ